MRMPHMLVVLLIGIAMLTTAANNGSISAQDETPEVIQTHPAFIHVGTCDALDSAPAHTLNDVGPRLTDDDQLPSGDEIKGVLTAGAVVAGESDVEVNLDELLDQGHALNIVESSQNPQRSIACGDIGGPVIDDKLIIGLKPVDDSGYAGVAVLDRDDDNVKVTIYLVSNITGEADPAATPTS